MNKSPLVAAGGAVRKSATLFILTTVLAGLFGFAGLAAAQSSPKGYLQIGFTATITNGSGLTTQRFKNVYLNVQQVRVNEISGAAPGSTGWQLIPAPLGLPPQNNVDLQVDANNVQNVPLLFNTVLATPNTYRQVEVDLDPATPGKIVPLCPGPSGVVEGCTPYPVILQSTVGESFSIPGISVSPNQLTTLIINLGVTVVSAPTSSVPVANTSVNKYVISFQGSQATTQQLATISGIVGVPSGDQFPTHLNGVRNLSVTAEIAGTNNIVSTATPDSAGNYTLQLPAAPTIGTYYDVYVAGGSSTYAADRFGPLFPGQSITYSPQVTPKQRIGTISGRIVDACTNLALQGATVQLLLPQAGQSTNCAANPGQCIVVATASTDVIGGFPLPGQIQTPGVFNSIPLPGPYTLEVSAAGYDTTFISGSPTVPPQGEPIRLGGTCTIGGTPQNCNFSLTSGKLSGRVSLTSNPVPNQSVVVQVFAEQSGTNNLVSALQTPLVFTNSGKMSQTFTMNVPTTLSTFDLFATSIDLNQGVTDPYTGHTILVQSGVQGFGGTVPSCSSAPLTADFAESMDCTGHGSISGIFSNPNTATTAVLSKIDAIKNLPVALMPVGVQGPVAASGTTPANPTFSFCAPGLPTVDEGSYVITRYDLPSPTPTPTPTPVGPTATPTPAPGPSSTPAPIAGASAVVAPSALPTPTSVASPCPSTCFESANPPSTASCPGVCNNVQLPSSL